MSKPGWVSRKICQETSSSTRQEYIIEPRYLETSSSSSGVYIGRDEGSADLGGHVSGVGMGARPFWMALAICVCLSALLKR